MNIYVIHTEQGRCVKEATSLRAARSQARKEHGTLNFQSAHRASIDELVEIKRFGGWLPVSVREDVERHEINSRPKACGDTHP